MAVYSILALVLFTLGLGGAWETEEKACNSFTDECAAVSGESLLQKSVKQSRLWSAGLEVEPTDDGQTHSPTATFMKIAEDFASSSRRHGLHSGYLGSPHCVSSTVEASQMDQLLLVTNGLNGSSARQTGGTDAPLDSTGFRDTTSMCCPEEMEMFFSRLLDSMGFQICSWVHIQGLMHWFSCVPDMDFAYVLTIIADGNPCKYWAPKGEVCPALEDSCEGEWCPSKTTTTITVAPSTTTIKSTTTRKTTTTKPQPPGGSTAKPTTTTTPQRTTTTKPQPPGGSTAKPTTTTTPQRTTTTKSQPPPPSTPEPTTTTTPPKTTTTKPQPPATTTKPSGCVGKKDVVIGIDASKSVEKTGWAAEAAFARSLIEALTVDGNPNGQRLNLHWFNAETMPIGSGGGQNSPGAFTTNPKVLLDALANIDYPNIRAGSTDHPQMYTTAEAALGSPASESKVLVLITDGYTHKGAGCGKLDTDTVTRKIGTCSKKSSHVCADLDCDFEKCMCGVYTAALFKEAGYKLVIVGIANLNHVGESEAGIFNNLMKECASPGQSYLASEFSDLQRILGSLTNDLCQ